MTSTDPGSSPPRSLSDPNRIAQIDVLRGFAVLGVWWIGVGAFGLPYAANALPTLLGTPSTLNLALWGSTEVFMEGAVRGVFSMLFGASALIYLDEARLARDGVALVDRFYRRNLILMLFGLVHAYLLLWPHDVLFAYGMLGLFIFPLRRAPTLVLLLVGVALQTVTNLEIDWSQTLAWLQHLPGSGVLDAADAVPTAAADPAETARFLGWMQGQMEQDIRTYRSGYPAIFAAQAAEVAAQQSTYFYQRHGFEIGGMMLIGITLYRWGVLSGRGPWWVYLLLMVFGFGVGGWLRGADLFHVYSLGLDPLDLVRIKEGDLDLGRLPVALGHVGLIGLLCRWGRAPWLTGPLAATGRLALTNYIGQTVIGITLFYGFGLGLFGQLERWQLALVFLGGAAFQAVFSVLWLKYFRYGPLEWVWRSLIFGQIRPLRVER
ncbi:MAG TPA: DUF418 domain-containing protein [Lamprocystis sp. (in: g-proteobacteria)]|nr:DUF418 domain-containing protein [Lamprocystis sp. (in: g-proteobacteria)]